MIEEQSYNLCIIAKHDLDLDVNNIVVEESSIHVYMKKRRSQYNCKCIAINMNIMFYVLKFSLKNDFILYLFRFLGMNYSIDSNFVLL